MHDLGLGVRQIVQEAGRIQTGEDRILDELARLHERMATLENQLSSNTAQDRSVPGSNEK
jgi:voltage-gated potassium channel